MAYICTQAKCRLLLLDMPLKLYLRFVLFLLLGVPPLSAKEAEEKKEDKVGLKSEIKSYIRHHLEDTHDFGLFSYRDEEKDRKVYVGLPLPVIVWDEGLKIFSSSQLNHGESVANVGGNNYKLYHGKIYKTDAEGTINFNDHHHPTNVKPLDFSITKSVVTIIFTALLMFFIFRGLAKSYQENGLIAKGLGRFFEPIVLYIRDDIARPNIGDKHYKKYISYLLTIFFFIWFLNILGLTPLGINVTGNIAVTLCLALITFLITTFTGKKDYWLHVFDPLGSSMKWYAKLPLYVILIPIEVLGLIIKPFSLLIRLYANIQAGHIVLMSLIGLMFIFKSWLGSTLSFGLAFAISLIEILVALLQAYIFTMLSALYFGFASEEH